MPPKAASGAATRSSFSLLPEHIKVNTDDTSRLGQGGFGIVFKGAYRLAPAAIKQLLVQDDLPPEKLAEFFQEAEMMATLHHPNVIQLYGYTEAKPYRIVMEFMPKGSLYRVLHNKSEELSWEQRLTWGMEIGAGLHYLHTCQPIIIHRDLKSLNILISKDDQAKLTDFGLALSNLRSTTKTVTATSKKLEGIVGSLRWMAPELFSLKPKYSQASDMFAYAMVLWELASREIPYSEVAADSIIQGAVMQGEREEIPSNCPRVLATLIQACWDQTPGNRPSAEKAVKTLQTLSEHPVDSVSQVMSRLFVKSAPVSKGYAKESQVPAAASQGYALASEVPSKPKPVAPAATAFFQAPIGKQAISQADIEKLLLHVARGEQDQAEAMLKIKGNEFLLLHKGKVTDYSNRTFNNITAFQVALWALDWHMWKMLLKYIPKDEAARQLQDLEDNSTEHGKHYDFTPLIQALKTYLNKHDTLFNAKNFNDLKNLWINDVGDAQTQVPAHVANEYCRPDRSFDPIPSFTEDTFPRTFDLYEDNKFFPLFCYSWGSLSVDFAIIRRTLDCGAATRLPADEGEVSLAGIAKRIRDVRCFRHDIEAISRLCEVRTGQYQALTQELTVQFDTRLRPR